MISHSLVTTRISSPEGMKVEDRHVTWVSANYPEVEVKQDRAEREVMANREVRVQICGGERSKRICSSIFQSANAVIRHTSRSDGLLP